MAKSHASKFRARPASRPLLQRLWQGKLPLWITYWLWGVGGNMAFVALLALVYLRAGGEGGGLAALWLVYGLSLGWFVLIFGAIWRAAGRYRGPRLWAVLARAGVLVGAMRMALEAGLLLGV